MKRNILIIILSLTIIIVGLLSCEVYWTFFDMSCLPKGTLISESESSNGSYNIEVYVSRSGMTADDFSILCELKYNKIIKEPKNIYWNHHESNANITWVDDNTATINGHKLNILKDTYDFRRGK